MNVNPARLAFCMALLLVPALCAAQAPAQWKPDPKLVSQLGPEVSVGKYKIRPPLGYTIRKQDATSDPVGYAWVGPTYSKNGASDFYCLVFASSPQDKHPLTLQEWTTLFYTKTRKLIAADAAFQPEQQGKLNTILFTRTVWAGHNQFGIAIRGVIYAGITADGLFLVEAVSTEPSSTDTLPLMEAAVLTFHKG